MTGCSIPIHTDERNNKMSTFTDDELLAEADGAMARQDSRTAHAAEVGAITRSDPDWPDQLTAEDYVAPTHRARLRVLLAERMAAWRTRVARRDAGIVPGPFGAPGVALTEDGAA